MGRPDTLDRLAQAMVALTMLFSIANGLLMVVAPLPWYRMIPTLAFTGPFNPHFIRDIGMAYVTCGLILAWAVPNLRMRWLAALSGGLWLSLHAAIHLFEVASGICGPGVFWADFPAVFGPPMLVLAAVGLLAARRRIAPAGLPNAMAIPAIEALGDSGYARELAAAHGHAFEAFLHAIPVTTHRHDAPASLFHMARIGATIQEDCGECALIAARAALADGVSRADVNAALAGGVGLAPDLTSAFAFGQAIALHSVETAERGDAIEAAHGRAVRLELALTAAWVRSYPGFKRGLGLSQACSATRLEV